MLKRVVSIIAVIAVSACSRSTSKPPYSEGDVRAFVLPGISREAIITRFGEPLIDEKNPKFEGGYTGVDEIIYYFLPSEYPSRPPPNMDRFKGFQVRFKEGKAVDWAPTTGN